jgi:hypothetical protein
MKGYTCTILTLAFSAALFGGSATADIITFIPPSANLDNLDHSDAYAWCLTPSIPTGQTITSVKLIVSDIYDWTVETNQLTVDLLNTPLSYGTSSTIGTKSNYLVTKANGNDSSTYWEKSGAWGGWERMFSWSDLDGPTTENELVYDFKDLYVYDQAGTDLLSTTPSSEASLQTFVDYLNDGGSLALAFAPACHFYNSGVELQITTAPTTTTTVPSPVAAVPFVVGLLVGIRRRR